MSKYKYELWESGRGKKIKRLFIRSDHNGDRIRKKLTKAAKITWKTEAETYFHAMQEYWNHMDRGVYTKESHVFPGEEL